MNRVRLRLAETVRYCILIYCLRTTDEYWPHYKLSVNVVSD